MKSMHDASFSSTQATPSAASAPRKKWNRWGVGAAVFGLLAGGGITWAVVSGGGTPASSASSARAAALNTALTDAAGNQADSPARVRWALGRLRHLGGVDGTATFHNKTGFHTLSFERGTIQSVSGSDVVIKAADGTTWTWHVVSDTVVRKNGAKTTTSALTAGETVFAGGPVVSGARDARVIIIRPSGPAGSGPANPSGSQSAQTSLS
ncbi:MAG TPA: hypothetical protein VGL33_11230 [Streptosporangiaceae bacterium]|jgi:hypothetical protein